MRWVIYHTVHEGWHWQAYDDEQRLLAASQTGFRNQPECLIDAQMHGYPRAFKVGDERSRTA